MMSNFPEPYTLVMIEDDEGHAHLLKKQLERTFVGNKLVHFERGSAAIDYFFSDEVLPKRNSKLVVLLDLNLPDVDGYEILRRLKEDERTSAIPVVVLTTTDNPREVDRCYTLGCNLYLTKPVEYNHFSEMIHQFGQMLTMTKLPHGYH